jgi:hypothetical protein
MFLRGGGRSRWKRPDGPAPSTEGEGQAAEKAAPEVPRGCVRKDAFVEETRGEILRERLGIHFRWRERPRGQKAQESTSSRPELILWVAKRETAYEVGESR